MTQPDIAAAVVVLCLVALWVLSPTFRQFVVRLFASQPNLEITELPAIFDGGQSFNIERNPQKKMPGADRSIQAINERVSVIYHTTKHLGGLTETVDISYPGKFGMIFTLINGRMSFFERIGGITRNNPQLSVQERYAVDRFMVSLRECFLKA
jgi:hypothetical protein